MMLLAIIAASAAQPVEARVGPVIQATATVRIISGKRLALGSKTADAELRQTSVRDVDGQLKQAQLIEFQ